MNKWQSVYYGISKQNCLDYAEREKATGSIGIEYKVRRNGTESRPWVLYFRFENIHLTKQTKEETQ